VPGKFSFITFMDILRFTIGAIICGTVLTFVAAGCSSRPQGPERPAESYAERFEVRNSTITLPLEFSREQLEQILNYQLDATLYRDDRFDDGDNMTVLAQKRDLIRLRIRGQRIEYDVPLGLQIQYDLGLGKVAATGDIDLHFRTAFYIDSTWNLRTESVLASYEWRQPPRLRLAGLSVSIETISNYFLRRSESQIGKAIDDQIAESLNLDQYIRQAWQLMHEPVELSETYGAWLLFQPQSLTMSPLESSGDLIRASLTLEGQPELLLGSRPLIGRAPPLPPFRYELAPEDPSFAIYVGAVIPYAEAERVIRESVVDSTFAQGRRSVTVKDVELYGQGNQLVVNLELAGSYNGSIYLTGRPEFNIRDNRVDIRDLDYTLETRSFLIKSASWLLSGTLKRKIQDNLDFLIDYNLADVRTQIETQLENYELAPGISLRGELYELDLYNAYLSQEGIKVKVLLDGRLALDIAGLQQQRLLGGQ
jgi:hypothetical protein